MSKIDKPFFVVAGSPHLVLGLLDMRCSERQWQKNCDAIMEVLSESSSAAVEIDVSRLAQIPEEFGQLLTFLSIAKQIDVRLLNATPALRSELTANHSFDKIQWQEKPLPKISVKRHFIVTESEGVHIVRLTSRAIQSDLDLAQLDSDLNSLLQTEPVKHAILNLEKLAILGSSGLATLVRLSAHLKAKGGDAAVCCLQSEMKNMFEFTRIDRVVSVCDTEEQAINRFT